MMELPFKLQSEYRMKKPQNAACTEVMYALGREGMVCVCVCVWGGGGGGGGGVWGGGGGGGGGGGEWKGLREQGRGGDDFVELYPGTP